MKSTQYFTKEDEDEETCLSQSSQQKPDWPTKLKCFWRILKANSSFSFWIGILGAFWAGASNSGIFIFIREVVNDIEKEQEMSNLKVTWNIDSIRTHANILLYICAIQLVGILTLFICNQFNKVWNITGSVALQRKQLRNYLKAVTIQEAEWYDQRNISELPTEINAGVSSIESALGKSFSFVVYSVSTALGSIVVSFYCAVILSFPLLIIWIYILSVGGFQSYIVSQNDVTDEKLFKESGAEAEQALSAITLVKAFGQERNEVLKFNKHLEGKNKEVCKQAWMFGFSKGMLEAAIYFVGAYSLLIGGIFITSKVTNINTKQQYTSGDITGAFSALQCGAIFIGISFINLSGLFKTQVQAYEIFEVIDRVPDINLDDKSARPVHSVSGDINIENVSFTYKTRNKTVLANVSLNIEQGSLTALVGPSGSGKSTLAKLLMRFYDPDEGRILVNGTDLKQLNLRDFRQRIGYVGQEPCLLHESIRNNLLNAKPDASEQDMYDALEAATALKFVNQLEDGLDTDVGAIGSKLSGGQKQRIAIARALIKKPDLLIFDEATSALDQENEAKVQEAIKKINIEESTTIIMIVSNLILTCDCENIIVLDGGKITGTGTHEQLLTQSKFYFDTYEDIDSESEHQHNKNSQLERILEIDSKVSENSDEKVNLLPEKQGKISQEESVSKTEKDEEPLKVLSLFECLNNLIFYYPSHALWAVCFVCSCFLSAGLPLACIPMSVLIISFGKDTNEEITQNLKVYIPILWIIGVVMLLLQLLYSSSMQYCNNLMINNLRSKVYSASLQLSMDHWYEYGKYWERLHNQFGQNRSSMFRTPNASLTPLLKKDIKDLAKISLPFYYNTLQGFLSALLGFIICFVYIPEFVKIAVFGIVICFLFKFIEIFYTRELNANSSVYSKQTYDYLKTLRKNPLSINALANEDYIVETYLAPEPSTSEKILEGLLHYMWNIQSKLSVVVLLFLFILEFTKFSQDNISITNVIIGTTSFLCGYIQMLRSMDNWNNTIEEQKTMTQIHYILEQFKEVHKHGLCSYGLRMMTPRYLLGNIEFHEVWFKYPGEDSDWVLQDFSLLIKPDESLGIHGAKGCGKTTLIKLLLRIYEPQKGFISVWGIPLNVFSLESIRSCIGWMPQDPTIFDATIQENIAYGRLYASAYEIAETVKDTGTLPLIQSLNKSYETEPNQIKDSFNSLRFSQLDPGFSVNCGRNGCNIPFNLQQHISLARAQIGKHKLLIADEPFKNMNFYEKEKFEESLMNIVSTKTSIIFSQNASNLNKWDRIVSIEKGRLYDNTSWCSVSSEEQ